MNNTAEKLEYPENLWREIVTHRQAIHENEIDNISAPMLFRENLEDVLKSVLDERKQQLIKCRYEQRMTYREIGELYGLGSERVRQILVYSVQKLSKSEGYYRLHAVPEREVIVLKSQVRALQKQNKELQAQIIQLFGEKEREEVELRRNMPLEARVGELNITTRSECRLIASGIDTVGKLVNCTEEQIKSIPKLGKVCFDDIITALAEFGYTLKGTSREYAND